MDAGGKAEGGLMAGMLINGAGRDKVMGEGILDVGSPTVGSEMLRLGDGIVRDGVANGGTLGDGNPIVGSEILRLGEGIATDGTPTDGKLGCEEGTSWNVALVLPTLGGVVGSMSRLGRGMMEEAGPVIGDKMGNASDGMGMLAEGTVIGLRVADGTVTEGMLADGSAGIPGLVGGV